MVQRLGQLPFVLTTHVPAPSDRSEPIVSESPVRRGRDDAMDRVIRKAAQHLQDVPLEDGRGRVRRDHAGASAIGRDVAGAMAELRWRAISTYSGFRSIPIDLRPSRRAAAKTVPLPANGSRTRHGTIRSVRQ